MKLCSVVVPCYNEEKALPIFYREATEILSAIEGLDYEFVFVDDGSSDNTLGALKEIASRDSRVKYIALSRNFGKEGALWARLYYSKGDYVVTMDADMQDPPSLLPEMYSFLSTGQYDCVATRRVNRHGEPPIRSFFARMFYKMINKMSKTEIVDGARDYRFMNRKMVNAILEVKEYNRFSKGIFSWVGFKTKWLEFENTERVAGETKWSFWKLFLYSINGIVAYTNAPLALASVMGVVLFIVSFITMIIIFVRALAFSDPVAGWPSIVCIVTFIGGVQLLCLGIIGTYLSKTYLEVKKRPIFIVADSNIQQGERDKPYLG